MIEESVKVEGTVVKMIHHKWQLVGFVYVLNWFVFELLVDFEEAQELTSLKYCLTHYIVLLYQMK